MPIYEYQCQSCNTLFEEWQSGFEEREMDCPKCGTPAKRLISHTSFQLKGSGWYVTDYAGKKPCTGSSDSSDDSKCDGGGESTNESAKADTGGVDSVPAAKKESSDTPSAGSAS